MGRRFHAFPSKWPLGNKRAYIIQRESGCAACEYSFINVLIWTLKYSEAHICKLLFVKFKTRKRVTYVSERVNIAEGKQRCSPLLADRD